MCSRSFDTRSLPTLLAATHRGFAFYIASPQKLHSLDRDVFYVAFPKGSIRPDLSILTICAWHAVASAKVGRSSPRGSVRPPRRV